MSLKARVNRLEKEEDGHWEAPMFVTVSEEDQAGAEAQRARWRAEIERDKARGRVVFGVDFRLVGEKPASIP